MSIGGAPGARLTSSLGRAGLLSRAHRAGPRLQPFAARREGEGRENSAP